MQELTDEDLFVLGVQDFLCNRRSNNKSEPIDTSGTYEEFHERMVKQRDHILLSRGQNPDACYKIKGTNKEDIFKELIELQQKIRKQQGLQEI